MKTFLGLLLVFIWKPCFGQLNIEVFAQGLSQPVDIVHAGDGSNRLFVVQKSGQIIVLDKSGQALDTFLDIREKVGDAGGERGLLGLAFHPKYSDNGYFFVNYTSTLNSRRTVIERYRVSGGNPNKAEEASGIEVLTFNQPFGNHNGGDLAFSPVDGYLYIPTGDGGSGNDPEQRAQNLTSPHGKILRIDVDAFSETPPYQIPLDNPFGTDRFISEYRDTVHEIWAWGLRNPWRFAFSQQGDLWIGDVGQEDWEEVNFVRADNHNPGLNYGWDCREGLAPCRCGNDHCDQIVSVDPVHVYDLPGQSITGGVVLEGPNYRAFEGQYLFADYVHDRLWVLSLTGDEIPANVIELSDSPPSISTFGTDESGVAYLASLGSNDIYKVVERGAITFELRDVRVNRFDKTNLLEWRITSKNNASHIEVERRFNQQDFLQIGIVPIEDRSSSNDNYHFPDEVNKPGSYLYRLKALNHEGLFQYSTIFEIEVSDIQGLLVRPNPASAIVVIELPLHDQLGQLQLMDLGGKIFYETDLKASPTRYPISLDVSKYPRGLVLVQFSSGELQLTQKLMLYH